MKNLDENRYGVRYFFVGPQNNKPHKICKTFKSAIRWSSPDMFIWARHADGTTSGPYLPQTIEGEQDDEL